MRVMRLVILSSCLACSMSEAAQADQLSATGNRSGALEIGVNHPDLAELVRRLAGQTIHIRTLPNTANSEDTPRVEHEYDYEAMNQSNLGMRNVSLLLVDCSSHKICDDFWLERLSNHGVSIIKLRHSTVSSSLRYAPKQLRQVCFALSEAIPDREESLHQNLAKELKRLRQAVGQTHQPEVVLSGSQ